MKLVVALASVALVACSSPGGGEPPPVAEARGTASQAHGPVVATFVTRDKKVAIVGGGRELRVVVHDTSGALVADGLSLAELRQRDPFLAVVVESAVAGADDGSYVDATLHKDKPKTKLLGDLDR